MNSRPYLITFTALLIAGGTSLAQGRPEGAPGQRPGPSERPASAAPAVAHLAEAYAKLAPFDVDKNEQLDAEERASLARAIADGEVEALTHRTPPEGITPGAGALIVRLTAMHARVAPYDADHDGTLSEAEQASLKADIESGKLGRPGGPRGGRPRA